jgi:hypothetical protein
MVVKCRAHEGIWCARSPPWEPIIFIFLVGPRILEPLKMFTRHCWNEQFCLHVEVTEYYFCIPKKTFLAQDILRNHLLTNFVMLQSPFSYTMLLEGKRKKLLSSMWALEISIHLLYMLQLSVGYPIQVININISKRESKNWKSSSWNLQGGRWWFVGDLTLGRC